MDKDNAARPRSPHKGDGTRCKEIIEKGTYKKTDEYLENKGEESGT